MKEMTSTPGELDWILDGMVKRVTQTRHIVLLSSDGLRIASSQGLDREDAEHLSALAASFQSLARSTSEQFGGGAVRQTIVELESAFLFVTAAGHGACLALLADSDVDVGIIAYEMALLVKRVGQYMSAGPRTAESEARR